MRYVLRLFIAGSSDHSTTAVRNLWAITRGPLESSADVAIIDVRQSPEEAELYNVFVTPTLLKLGPGTVRRVVGDLSDSVQVLDALGIGADACLKMCD